MFLLLLVLLLIKVIVGAILLTKYLKKLEDKEIKHMNAILKFYYNIFFHISI